MIYEHPYIRFKLTAGDILDIVEKNECEVTVKNKIQKKLTFYFPHVSFSV